MQAFIGAGHGSSKRNLNLIGPVASEKQMFQSLTVSDLRSKSIHGLDLEYS